MQRRARMVLPSSVTMTSLERRVSVLAARKDFPLRPRPARRRQRHLRIPSALLMRSATLLGTPARVLPRTGRGIPCGSCGRRSRVHRPALPDMTKQRRELSDQQKEVLEVLGFDVMAQVEAMLRHVRQYQREVQRLRGILGKGQTSTAHRTPIDAVRTHANELHKTATAARETIDEIVRTVRSAQAKNGSAAADAPARPTRSSRDLDRAPRR
jgi:hypothetical protein